MYVIDKMYRVRNFGKILKELDVRDYTEVRWLKTCLKSSKEYRKR